MSLQDALATDVQPNVPGTTSEHPNWRHRYVQSVETLLSRPDVVARLGPARETRPGSLPKAAAASAPR